MQRRLSENGFDNRCMCDSYSYERTESLIFMKLLMIRILKKIGRVLLYRSIREYRNIIDFCVITYRRYLYAPS